MTKGEETRAAILDQAVTMATRIGLEGLSIGSLAGETGMSKSGLFAHFESKQNLQLAVLQTSVDRFISQVVAPALGEARGLPRVRALFENWLAWSNDPGRPGGCFFIAAANELDDRPGPLRDRLVAYQRDWLEALATAARIAVEESHLRARPRHPAVRLRLLLHPDGVPPLQSPDARSRRRDAGPDELQPAARAVEPPERTRRELSQMPRTTPRKKTNVRAEMIGLALRWTAAVSTRAAARGLERLFLGTRRHTVPERELSWLATAESTRFASRGESLAAWVWGSGRRTVLLAHGCGGPGCPARLFRRAVGERGASGRDLRRARPRRFAAEPIFAGRDDRCGPRRLVVLRPVPRRGGALGGRGRDTIALDRGLQTERAVFIAPPTDLGAFLETVTTYLGLSDDVARETQKRIEERFGVRWDTLRLERIAPSMATPLLVLHDRHDREVAFDHGRKLASLWPDAELVPTEGLGHRRVLRDPGVVESATRFLDPASIDARTPSEP